ncbi:MAG TPA: hypothetical protein VNI20_08375 [Fimbriimonadaceae bacterium]|nr:hypothetical protein [Fimbriimonadaceae bacterium]
MEFLSNLWMPIVLSAVFVWIASAILHMVLPHHKGEFKGLPDENSLLNALKGVDAGQYMFPWCSDMKAMKDPAFVEKMKNNPNGVVTVWPGPVEMGRNMFLTFLFFLVSSVFVAYVCWHARSEMPDYMAVFRMAGTIAFLAYGFGWIPPMIWFRTKGFWAHLFDAVVMCLLTAGTFGWLWPHGM